MRPVLGVQPVAVDDEVVVDIPSKQEQEEEQTEKEGYTGSGDQGREPPLEQHAHRKGDSNHQDGLDEVTAAHGRRVGRRLTETDLFLAAGLRPRVRLDGATDEGRSPAALTERRCGRGSPIPCSTVSMCWWMWSLRASGEEIDDSFEPWRDLITDIRALRLTVYDIADRLRSLRSTG